MENSPNSKISDLDETELEQGTENDHSKKQCRNENQNFHELRNRYLAEGVLFEDPDFPANDSSLYYSRKPERPIVWMRPSEIVKNPQLWVEGFSRFDVQQGELGNCWLLAAVANLTMYPQLFQHVVPGDQSFEENYAGIFHFKFWQHGQWVDVVIDDLLPTYNGQLVYLHSSESNEFWSALLEKAYAKVNGSYEALEGGFTCEAMEDFTGGVTEVYQTDNAPSNLFSILLKAYERNSMMGCSIEPDPNVLEAKTPQGLIRGHAYSISCVKYVDIEMPNQKGKIQLLRIRNPWGNEAEWNGPWSDQSPEWKFIPDNEKQQLGLTFDADGEFWMSFVDFQRQFSLLEICHLDPDSLCDDDLDAGKKRWERSVFHGEWVRGVTAGGCTNYRETFWHNPQYRVTLEKPDEDDSECTLIIALMQKNRRAERHLGADFLTIGFAIYRLENPDRLPKPLEKSFFERITTAARSPSYINLREVNYRVKLPPGTYCIVPSTFKPNEEGEFMLRVFSETQSNLEENEEAFGTKELDDRINNLPDPLLCKNNEEVYEFFKLVAGDDLSVDWSELQELFDYVMRNELLSSHLSLNTIRTNEENIHQSLADLFVIALSDIFCCKKPTNKRTSQKTPAVVPRGFSDDFCKSMMVMLDRDHSGKLEFEDFQNLWREITKWKAVFLLYDKDNTGELSPFELRQALNSAGYILTNQILNILMHRYGTKDGTMTFDNFILCAVRLKTMIETYRELDTDSAIFSLDDWLKMALYS